MSKKRWAALGVVLAVTAICVGVAPVRDTLGNGLAALDPRDLSRARTYLLSFGPWAPVVSFLLMVAHSVLVPFPAFVITLANGALFGAFWGTVLSWTSAQCAAAISFGLVKLFGRPLVERLVGPAVLDKADTFFDRYGSHAVLIGRLIPVISFDGVSYAAGLTSMGLWPFLLATGIGQLPATIVYSLAGDRLTGDLRGILWMVGALVALVVLGLVAKAQVDRRLDRRDASQAPESLPA